MTTPEKQREYVRRSQEKTDVVTVRPPKGTKDRWRQAAEERGLSLQRFIIQTMDTAVSSTYDNP